MVSEVDWSGPTMKIVDATTGELITVYLFVATLPYSQYSYVEPCLDMKQNIWIKCNVNMFEFFGGSSFRITGFCHSSSSSVPSKASSFFLSTKTAAVSANALSFR